MVQNQLLKLLDFRFLSSFFKLCTVIKSYPLYLRKTEFETNGDKIYFPRKLFPTSQNIYCPPKLLPTTQIISFLPTSQNIFFPKTSPNLSKYIFSPNLSSSQNIFSSLKTSPNLSKHSFFSQPLKYIFAPKTSPNLSRSTIAS